MPSFPSIVGRCTASFDSRKPYTSLTLAYTLHGHRAYFSGATDDTTADHSFTWIRAHPAGADIRGAGSPAEDGFWIVQGECCCPCRWTLTTGSPTGPESPYAILRGIVGTGVFTDAVGGTTTATLSDSASIWLGGGSPCRKIGGTPQPESAAPAIHFGLPWSNAYHVRFLETSGEGTWTVTVDAAAPVEFTSYLDVVQAAAAFRPCDDSHTHTMTVAWDTLEDFDGGGHNHRYTGSCTLTFTLA